MVQDTFVSASPGDVRLGRHLVAHPVQCLSSCLMDVGKPAAGSPHDPLELMRKTLRHRLPDRNAQGLGRTRAILGEELDVPDGHQLNDAPLRRRPSWGWGSVPPAVRPRQHDRWQSDLAAGSRAGKTG